MAWSPSVCFQEHIRGWRRSISDTCVEGGGGVPSVQLIPHHLVAPPASHFAQGGKAEVGDEMAVTVRAKADNGNVSVRATAATVTQAQTRIHKPVHTGAQQQQRHCNSSTLHLGKQGCTPLRVPPFVPSSAGARAQQWRGVHQTTTLQSATGGSDARCEEHVGMDNVAASTQQVYQRHGTHHSAMEK